MYNACPRFEYTDLTVFDKGYLVGFDYAFPVSADSVLNRSWPGYDANDWWNRQRGVCRTSLAYSKVSPDLFSDKRLWQFVDAPGVDFSNMNLDGCNFAGSNLRGANFTNASLKGTIFVTADLTGANLTGAHLEGATLDGVALHRAKTFSKAFLSGMSLRAPNLSGLDMSGAQLKAGQYTTWDGHAFAPPFSPASLAGAYMYNTKLNGADLSGAFLEGVSWFGDAATGENAVMEGTHFEHADLPGLNLKKAHLRGANFTDALLVNADLSTMNALDYSFRDTTSYQANLKGANLSGANLYLASLSQAVIYAGAVQQIATVEVLADPEISPNTYRFFQQAYSATKAPASTDGIAACPNGTRSPDINHNCGALTSDYWVTAAPPREPTGCTLRAARPGEVPDDKGMVLECTSERHRR